MRVLCFTNMYPEPQRPVFGIFIKEEHDALLRIFPELIIDRVQLSGGGLFRKYFTKSFWFLKKIVERRPDIIHVHFGLTFVSLWLVIPYAKLRKIPVLYTSHGGDLIGASQIVRFISRSALRICDAAIFVSRETARLAPQSLHLKQHIPCGVNPEIFYPCRKLYHSLIKNNEYVIVFPSSPNRVEKNFARFCSIVESVKKQLPAHKIVVRLIDGLDRKDVALLLSSAVCVLMTSHYEGSPQVVKEAVFCGCPVISVDVGDVKDVVSGVHGCQVTDLDSELAQACITLITNGIDADSFSITSEKIVKDYKIDNVAKRILDVYNKMLG